MITVFYDGKCGLCAKEINYYRRIAPVGVFVWQDITDPKIDLTHEEFSLAEGLELLHIKDADGQLHIGVDGFILLWRQMKYWRLLAAVVALPPIRQLAHKAYTAFARRRFQRLEHCQLARKNERYPP